MSHISGKSFDLAIGASLIHFEGFSLTITDNTAVAMTHGVPDGFVDGDTSAEGEFDVDENNFELLLAEAKKAGSFKAIPPLDVVTTANTETLSRKIEVFGCKFKISDLLSLDPKGGEKHKTKLPFLVTGREFIRINGVPYLDAKETESLI